MGLLDFLKDIFNKGYASIADYCNQNDCEVDDVLDDYEEAFYGDENYW